MTGRISKVSTAIAKLRGSSALQIWRSFRRDESGVLTFPTVAFMLAMLAIGGIGVDLIRLERDRTVLQYTLDRAVLAAADLDQTLDAKAVVKDYLTKSGLEKYYSDDMVEVDELKIGDVTTSRSVAANVDATFAPYWLKFSGYDTELPLKGASTAKESIGNVEISLVLDVSGSMGSNNRLYNLKIAAKEFVQTMHDNTEEGKLSISIVPYSSQVSMPQDFIEQLTTTGENDHSYCLNFDESDYNIVGLPLSKTYERTMHFSRWGWSDYRSYSGLVRNAECAAHSDTPSRTSMLFQDDVTKLQNYIDSFRHADNTAIDVGMKWGVALLDPSVQPVIAAMTQDATPEIEARFADRPVPYSDHETLKVVVLMTDGENTEQGVIQPGYRFGASGVWYNAEEHVYSTTDTRGTEDPSDDRFYWHHTNEWSDHPYGNGTQTVSTYICTSTRWGSCSSGYWDTSEQDEPGTAVSLSFAELFARTDLQYIYNSLYSRWMSYWQARQYWYTDAMHRIGPQDKNPRTLAVCQAAKDQGIVVFSIGFEAPWAGKEILRECASSDAHYYDVRGLEIRDAFKSIASAIRQLRLTE